MFGYEGEAILDILSISSAAYRCNETSAERSTKAAGQEVLEGAALTPESPGQGQKIKSGGRSSKQ